MNKNTLIGLAVAGLLLYFVMSSKSAPTTPPPSKTKVPSGSNGGDLTTQIVGQVSNLATDILKKLFGTGSGNGSKAGQSGGSGSAGSANTKGGSGGGSDNGAQPGPTPAQLATSGLKVDDQGNVTDNGKNIGYYDSNHNLVFTDGSVLYADGTAWDPITGYYTDSTGCMYLADGTIIGQLDEHGYIEAVRGAMFDGNGAYIGSDNFDGSYTAPNGDIINSDTGAVEGYDNGDGTWTGTDGTVYADDNTVLGQTDPNNPGDWIATDGTAYTEGDYSVGP
jgi:hypothetical protein